VRKILIMTLLLAAPAAVLAMQPLPSGSEGQDTPATGNNAAKSHHARHPQKRSKHSSHKAQKHHVSKQHSQPQ
jgi:hypothetical protein